MKIDWILLMGSIVFTLVLCVGTSIAQTRDHVSIQKDGMDNALSDPHVMDAGFAEDPIVRVIQLLHIGGDYPYSLAAAFLHDDGIDSAFSESYNKNKPLNLEAALFKPDAGAAFHYATLYVSPKKSASQLRMSTDIAEPVKLISDQMAVYVWDSHDLISKQQYTDAFWQGFNKLSISRLLLSLDSSQIERARTNPDSLQNFLSSAKKHNVAVELLLGEPTWITAQGRVQLADIIKSLDSFSFAGLNLDIEPDQIYRQPLSRQQFDDWLATIKLAAQTSPWPTALSVHPRYFRDAPYTGWKIEQRLRDAGIRDVVLMIYNSDPRKVAQIAKPITRSATGIRFRIAQSVEAELDAGESHARRSPEEFMRTMHQLQSLLAAQTNTEGIVLQAWADLMRMGYENKIQ